MLIEANNEERKVFFVDAAHFVMGGFLGYIWCFVRLFLHTSSGRQRYNVLGAVDAFSKELISVCNTTYINAQSVCELLNKIRLRCENFSITLIMDNARYQKCKLVMQYAKELNIDLLFLPSYSPQLNLIERLWKWVKKECLYCKYYETFEQFKTAIDNSLAKVGQNDHKETFDKLLSQNFQTFNETQFIT